MKRISIVEAGWPAIGFCLGLSAASGLASLWNASFLVFFLSGAAASGLLLWFFRDPEREPESRAALLRNQKLEPILAPADGKVTDITTVDDFNRIGIFLSVFDCHVQRSPLPGQVTQVTKKEGLYLAAFRRDASKKNASATITLENPAVGIVRVRQIAGLLARRIITEATPGVPLKLGERLGMILLGSRVELELPKAKVKILVREGDKVKAGTSVVGSYEIQN